MDTSELMVLALALAGIVFINWYFFMSQRAPVVVAGGAGGSGEVNIRVLGGYDPATVSVQAGARLRLVFDRQETSSCSEELVIPAFGVRRFLPAFEKTVVEVTPDQPGSYEFTCGMGMLRGKIIVSEPSK